MADPENRTLSDKFILRLPDGMRDRIKAAAASNNRSMNSEIIARLEATFVEAPSREEIDQAVAKAAGDILAYVRQKLAGGNDEINEDDFRDIKDEEVMMTEGSKIDLASPPADPEQAEDYAEIYALWRALDGMNLNSEALARLEGDAGTVLRPDERLNLHPTPDLRARQAAAKAQLFKTLMRRQGFPG